MTTTPATTPAAAEADAEADVAPRPHHRWMGLLPYIGLMFFVWHAGQLLSGPRTGDWKHDLVMYGVVDLVGIAALGAGISHLFFAKPIARSIGWETNGFQYEIGFANVAFGTVGLMAGGQTPAFWLAVIVASGVFRMGAGVVHIRDIVAKGNFAVNNTAILFINFVVPAFLFAAWHAWA